MEQMYICLAIFAIMVILFLSRKIPMAFSALIAMVLLIITGCIDANSALATFGSTTVITMASMYIVAAGLARTQMINKMSNALLKATSGSFTKVLMTYVIATTILGQFVPSIIATFVMVTPMVKNTCEKMNISPSKMMFPVAIASVSCSFLVIPIGPYAADYVMYNGYLESYGWYDTAFTIWTDTPVLVITGIFTILVSVFLVPKLLPDQPDVEIGEIKRRAMKQKEPLDPVREMLGYGVFVVVILGLMTGILPAWEVTMIGALVVVATGVLTEQEAIDNLGLCLFLCQPQRHQLHDLLPCNLTDCSLMDQGGIDIIGNQARNGEYLGIVHDDGIALRVSAALCIAYDFGIEGLL